MNNAFADLLGYGLKKSEIYNLVSKIECDLLITVFIVLKLTGQIGWSWWYVFTPAYVLMIINLIKLYLQKRK